MTTATAEQEKTGTKLSQLEQMIDDVLDLRCTREARVFPVGQHLIE